MTKVRLHPWRRVSAACSRGATQVFFVVKDEPGPPIMGRAGDDLGYVNRHGLSRKVVLSFTEDRLSQAEDWSSTSLRLLRTA